jgi:hypothetical protein
MIFALRDEIIKAEGGGDKPDAVDAVKPADGPH